MPSRLQMLQEFVGGGEREGEDCGVGHHAVAGVGVPVDDESAANGVKAPFAQDGPAVVEGPEGHPVGVGGEGFAAVQDHVLVPVEVHPVVPADPQLGVEGRGGHLVISGGSVHGFRVQALQPQDDCLVRTMPAAGRAQGAEQLGLDPGGGT